MTPKPIWLALLAPLPADIAPVRKPVASAEQIAQDTAGPIAGWENVTLHLSDPAVGLRHFHVVLDTSGAVIAAGDHVMVIRETTGDGCEVTLSDHESIGGRFGTDGSFNGTCWHTRLTQVPGQEYAPDSQATSAIPSAEEVSALRRLVDEIMHRPYTRPPAGQVE